MLQSQPTKVEINKTLQQLTSHFEGIFTPQIYADKFTFKHENVTADLLYTCTSSEIMELTFEKIDKNFEFKLFSLSLIDRIFFSFFGNPKTTNYKKFNKRFRIETNNELKVKTALDPSACQLFFNLLNSKNINSIMIHSNQTKIIFTLNVWLKTVEELLHFINTSIKINQVLNHS